MLRDQRRRHRAVGVLAQHLNLRRIETLNQIGRMRRHQALRGVPQQIVRDAALRMWRKSDLRFLHRKYHVVLLCVSDES